MFTSKKAQYLDNNFNKISPLINIDSLYYEQAVSEGNDIKIYRRTFVKYMPVQFNKNFELMNSSAYALESLSYDVLQETNTSVYINAYIHTEDIKNPYNSDTDEYLYDTSLFKVIGEKYIELHEILNSYEQLYYFNSSIIEINPKIEPLNTSIKNVSNCIDALCTLIYNNTQADPSQNNDIYFIEYKPNNINNTFMYIQVQNISTDNIYEQISLDNASTYENNNEYVKDWTFHYDTSSNKIMYLKDEYGNEGNFDFRNIKLQNNALIGISQYTTNNKIYVDPQNSSILFNSNSDLKYESNISIVNSTNIAMMGDINNLEIYNSSAYMMIVNGGKNNKIYNYQNSSIYFNDSYNNTIINCNNCSILIDGSNNYISNLYGVSLKLGSNNIIIGDGSTNTIDFGSSNFLNNVKLFLGDSIRMAYTHNLNNGVTIFGSNTNDVNVYVKSINTLR